MKQKQKKQTSPWLIAICALGVASAIIVFINGQITPAAPAKVSQNVVVKNEKPIRVKPVMEEKADDGLMTGSVKALAFSDEIKAVPEKQ